MQLILWRHAEAQDGEDDLARQLTAKGQRQAQAAAAQLRKRLPKHYRLWASQAARSLQTAAALGSHAETLSALNPDADVRDIVPLLHTLPESDTLVMVGHQPWIGDLCAFLLNQNWRSDAYWSVKKGAFWWFQCHYSDGVYLSKLKLMLPPYE